MTGPCLCGDPLCPRCFPEALLTAPVMRVVPPAIAHLDEFVRTAVKFSREFNIPVFTLVTWASYRMLVSDCIDTQQAEIIAAENEDQADEAAVVTMADNLEMLQDDIDIGNDANYQDIALMEFALDLDPEFSVPLIQRKDVYQEMCDAIDKTPGG